jgi:hypothetical protein
MLLIERSIFKGQELKTRNGLKLKKLQKLQFLFVTSSVGLSMLASLVLGFIVGLTLMVAVFIAVILYINKRQTKVSSLGFNDSDKSSNEISYPNYSGCKLTYVCLSCGTKVSDRTCRRCGSHMKKVVF